jgi:hypothetical protein
MIELPRLFPAPCPPIHPLPEYAVTGERAARYTDMKQVLQVPWMGVVTMAYAHYPTFFGELWRGLKPLCVSAAFVQAAQALRALAESGAPTLAPYSIVSQLRAAGYGEREIADIRAMIEVFSHGNPLYLLIATVARLLLEDGEMSPAREAPRFEGRHAPPVQVPFVLMEAHHADGPTRALYEEVKTTLALPFVNTDYRALARWPSYFAVAWSDLKEIVRMPVYEAQCEAVHTRVVAIAQELPNPGSVTGATLKEAAAADAPLMEVLEVSRLFQYLLPGLMVNVAVFRRQLSEV